MVRTAGLALAIGLALAASARAEAPAPTGAEYFAGRWQATSRDPASGETLKIVYVVEPAEGGRWFAGSGRTADGQFSSRDMWGRDPLTGELMRMVFDSSGAMATVRAAGWQGDRLALEGEVRSSGGTMRVRETITRLAPDRFEAVWEAYRGGKWSAYALESLTRET